jgi:hypothetical protein
MANFLSISSSLEHDGDELVRFQIGARSKDFAGSTLAWGYVPQLTEFAACLAGFPKAGSVPVVFQFGSDKTGVAKLEFVTLDGVGHCGVWITLEAPYPASRSQSMEQASIFLSVEPAAIDLFVSALHRFSSGGTHEAVLHGIAS